MPALRWTTWMLFILANVLVSAVTSLLVVRVLTTTYSQPQVAAELAAGAASQSEAPEPRTPATTSVPVPAAQLTLPAPSTPESPHRSEVKVRISKVIYPGQRTREAVVLVNEGDAPVDLTGWTLSNPRGQTYTFGAVILMRNGFINVYTTRGADSPTDLFWNLDQAAW
ncbi:MAG: lamin tail domain-containing protein, partial [Thermoflexales bacterium]|nr:lamin tail domain-containing protein [Thermoflexales bacterium]